MRLIDVDELLNDIEDAIDIENDGQDIEKSKFIILGLKIAKKYIKKALAIEAPPVKHGRWILQNRHDEDGRCIYHCSECNLETKVFPCNLIPWQMHEKYCAGCGARMDGESE